MSMTAYDTRVSKRARTLAREKGRARSCRPIIPLRCRLRDANEKDTRPSGERESGSYSGTRQRNRIQFGPS